MPTFRQMSDTVSPLARSRSASRSSRATSSAVLRLLMGPSVGQSTRRLPFRLDQFLGSRPRQSEALPTLFSFQSFSNLARRDESVSTYKATASPPLPPLGKGGKGIAGDVASAR